MKKNLIKSWVVLSLLTSSSLAEEATSGNLLPNAGTGQTNYQNSSGSIDGINSATGWTLNGAQHLGNEIEIQGTGKISANGSLVGIETTKATDGASFTTTTDSLDGGVRLNSTTEVQNCEWSGSAYACGQHTSGRDSYSTTVTILDENNSALSTVTQNRNNDAGYYGNTYTYTDTVIFNGTGARNWNWEFSGLDGDSPNSTNLVGPNLLGASLTATLLDINYTALPPAIQTELTSFDDEISKEFKELEESFKFEEPKFTYEEPKLETFKEPVKMETKAFEEAPSPSGMSQKESLSGPGATFTETSGPSGGKTPSPQKEESTPVVEESAPANAGASTGQKEAQESQISEADDTETNDSPTEKAESKQPPSATGTSDNASSDVKGSSKISLAKTMEKIDAEVKDIGKNLKLKNLVKIKLMSDNRALESYANIEFYKPKNIYLDQAKIRDNRILYNDVTLVSYQQKDPVFQKKKQLFEIRQEKEKLIKELRLLKNG